MSLATSHDAPVDLPQLFRASSHGADTRESRRLSRGAARGRLVAVHPGVYAPSEEWTRLGDEDRHRLRIRAAMPSLAGRLVVSHRSALALHGLPTLGPWPARVHVTDPARRNGHSERYVVKHGGQIPDEQIELIDGMRVTSLERTLLDVARTTSFSSAVVSVDAALREKDVTTESLCCALAAQSRRHGATAASRVLVFASGLSDSPGESWCRCRFAELGAPRPILQHQFAALEGVVGPVDFWFESAGVVVEFDGDVKYRDPRFRQGLPAEEVVLRERRRERKILALPEVKDVVRADWRDVDQLWRLRTLLANAGVPVD